MGCGLSCVQLTKKCPQATSDDDHHHHYDQRANGSESQLARSENCASNECEPMLSEGKINHKSFTGTPQLEGALGAAQMDNGAHLALAAHNVGPEQLFGKSPKVELEQYDNKGGEAQWRETSKRKCESEPHNLSQSKRDLHDKKRNKPSCGSPSEERRKRRGRNQCKRTQGNTFGTSLVSLLLRRRRRSSARIDATREPSENEVSRLSSRGHSTSFTIEQAIDFVQQAETPSLTTDLFHSTMSPLSRLSNNEQHSPSRGREKREVPESGCHTPTIRLESAQEQLLDDEVTLVTSLNQLCYEIIKQKLVQRSPGQHNGARPLCLFVFGRPGSSKGELAFELVEHSALLDFIARANKLVDGQPDVSHLEGEPTDCPLFHYLDVSALIVANIDARIREYNRLVAQALRARRSLMASRNEKTASVDSAERDQKSLSRSQEDDSENSRVDFGSQESREEDVDNDVGDDDKSHLNRDSSIGSDLSSGSLLIEQSCKSPARRDSTENDADFQGDARGKSTGAGGDRHLSDQFGLVSLSTKQRSIMQLKMVKYACCVTAKWVMSLIEREINLLEGRFAEVFKCQDRTNAMSLPAPSSPQQPQQPQQPARVYLVNLVPDQLSLFKTCLYLQQDLPLSRLKMPHWAVKFERRTNIRLMSKERGLASTEPNQTTQENATTTKHQTISLNPDVKSGGGGGKRVLIQFKKLSQIKFPTILAQGPTTNTANAKDIAAHNQHHHEKEEQQQKNNHHQQQQQSVGAVATSLLVSGSNEKLGPKYNDLFADQFSSLNKLTRLRYNPTRNYNYSDNQDYGSQDEEHENQLDQHQDEESEPRTRVKMSSKKISCYLQLRRHLESATSPSLSMFASSPPERAHSTTSSQFLASPSPCPSSLISCSEESLISSIDSSELTQVQQQQHRRHQQQQQHQLSPDANIIKSGQFRFSPTAIGTVQHSSTAGQVHPKWAVELELIDEQAGASSRSNRWHSRAPLISVGNISDQLQEASASSGDCYLHVYRNDAKLRPTRSRSHTSLLFSASGGAQTRDEQRANSTTPNALAVDKLDDHYYLVATRVAYANGKSQPVLEVKRLHKRILRCCGSRSDLAKLRKLIVKACAHLTCDLDTWLSASIASSHEHEAKSIALVTYTIRVDVAKYQQSVSSDVDAQSSRTKVTLRGSTSVKQESQSNSNSGETWEDPIARLLKAQPQRSSLAKQRPTSALVESSLGHVGASLHVAAAHGSRASLQVSSTNVQDGTGSRPASTASSQRSSTRSVTGRRRHVQFKLNQAPTALGPAASSTEGELGALAQRRVWLRDSLFVSSSEPHLFQAMDSLIAALKSSSGLHHQHNQ